MKILPIATGTLLGAAFLFAAQPAHAQQLPEPLALAVNQAEAGGMALALAVGQDQLAGAEEELTARARVTDACDLKYKAYKVLEQDRPVFYLLAQPPTPGSIVFGRHYRIAGDSVSASTKSCFVSPPNPPGAVGAFATHLLSEVPSEFHVFLSLVQDTTIYVGTSYGAWRVVKGKVSLLQRRK
jgi:hypothetical protein